MSEHLFILGAGASFDAGAPLMKDFLDVAEDLMVRDPGLRKREEFETVFDVINDLQAVHSKARLDLVNIESLFGAVEMAGIIGKLGRRTPKQIAQARRSLVTLIVTTLERSIKYTDNGMKFPPPKDTYSSFASLLKTILAQREHVSVITFNYDIALDYACLRNAVQLDYGLGPPPDTPPTITLPLLKLHGSTNWTTCKKCKAVHAVNVEHYLRHQDPEKLYCGSLVILNASDYLTREKHPHEDAAYECDGQPVIVPPTWNKTQYHGSLTRVWSRAAQELQSARNIYVIGHSLPESDAFFRYLFALGTSGASRIRRFWLFDPYAEGEIGERYRRLLGQGVVDRFVPHPKEFKHAVGILSKELTRAR